jgi:hypothetical protein
MMTESIVQPNTAGQTDMQRQALAEERRRPGRAPVSPTLLPLLRRGATDTFAEPQPGIAEHDVEWEAEDSMAPSRGIVFGLILSLPIWALVFFAYHEVAVHLAVHS